MRIASAALLMLALAGLANGDDACPIGYYRVCLGACLCSPVDPGQAGQVLQGIEQMAAKSLALALQQVRDQAQARGTQSIPLHIRAQLEPWYDFAVLDAARYRVDDGQSLGSASALMHNPDINALTLIDTIIFRHATDAEDDLVLWAHELKHVQQYQALGVDGFAQRYTHDFDSLEAPAYVIEAEVRRALREHASGQAR